MIKRLALACAAILATSSCSRSDRSAEPKTPAPASAADVPDVVSSERLARGRAVFIRTCAVCHQATGTGVKGIFPPLDAATVGADPARLIRIVLHGLRGPLTVKGVAYDSVMPAQGPLLKDHEIADVLTYVRHTWGNEAGAIETDAVIRERNLTPRTTMWTWAELNPP